MDPKYQHIGNIEDKVMEEVGELLQAIGKIRRFGLQSRNPYVENGPTNREQAITECDDVIARVAEFRNKLANTGEPDPKDQGGIGGEYIEDEEGEDLIDAVICARKNSAYDIVYGQMKVKLSESDLDDICTSYNHAYWLLPENEQKLIRFTVEEVIHAYKKNLGIYRL